ncbi:MAG: hypothetical protein N2Z21_09875 [Candidatus Sumerlaeaceae bacterium]|nr:hypothetical protein [Candidatus Sumerlaeaceae bacterium]
MAQENGTLRQCPLCEATLPEGQSKCLFCGNILETEQEKAKSAGEVAPSELLITAAYALIGLSALAMWLGVWRLSPMLPRVLLFVALVALTNLTVALVVARDATRMDVATHAYGVPWKWFLATLFLMPLAIITYSAVRARCGGADHTRAALTLAVVWLASALFVAHAVQDKPVIPPEVQRQWEDQLNRTIELRESAAMPSQVNPQGTTPP